MDSTLQVIWRTPKAEPNGFALIGSGSVITQPVIMNGNLYIAYDSVLQCLNVKTGNVIWTSSLLPPNPTKPRFDLWGENMLVDNNTIILNADNYVLCFSTSDGSRLWSWYSSPSTTSGWQGYIGQSFNTFSQSSDAVFVGLNNYPGEVVALRKSDGSVIWDVKQTMVESQSYEGVQGACDGRNPTYMNGRVYIGYSYGSSQIGNGLYHDGSITSMDAATGAILWKLLLPVFDTSLGGKSFIS
jgi:outer membrane protein assembly factor BamB